MEQGIGSRTRSRARSWLCLRAWAVSLAALAMASAGTVEASVEGCGGFVQASKQLAGLRKPSDPKLDYSSIVVEVQNSEGLVKERVHCAPNGYYFVPVYDQGTFIVSVRGPPGWTFEPNKVEVVVDSTSACNGGNDINFYYTGFSVSGRILGARGTGAACEQGAPEGVDVTLTSRDSASAFATKTGPDGSFALHNVPVGEYEISASHPTWGVATEPRASTKVEVGWGPVNVPDTFRVKGYDLSGSVLAQGNPVPGVTVYLFSQNLRKLANCPLGPGSSSPLPGRTPLCHAVTDASGRFVFPELFCGEYDLAAEYSGESTRFDVAPRQMAVNVSHACANAPKTFQVLGFSLGGQVVDSVGAGVPNAEVIVDGAVKTVTDAKGKYVVEHMTSRTYTIAARKQHYTFADVPPVAVVPSIGSLPTIAATHYDVCGVVAMDPDTTAGGGGAGAAQRRKVTLVDQQEKVQPQAKTTEDNGTFCFTVPPGRYTLRPHVSAAEVAAGLLFEPESADVKVVARPLTMHLFQQAHLSVSGVVQCVDACSPLVEVSLVPIDAGATDAPRSVRLNPDSDAFTFERVLPGSYRLQARKLPADTNSTYDDKVGRDEWCWSANGVDVTVTDRSLSGLRLRQKGWRLLLNSSVVDVMDVWHPTEALSFNISVGLNDFCLAKSGEYGFMFMQGCHFFGFLILPWSTEDPYVVPLEPQSYLIKGKVYVDSRKFQWANNMTDYALAEVFYANGTKDPRTIYLMPKVSSNASHPITEFEWSFWGEPGEEFYVRPVHSGKLLSEFKSEHEIAEELRLEAEKEIAEKKAKGMSDEEIEREDEEHIAKLTREGLGEAGEEEGDSESTAATEAAVSKAAELAAAMGGGKSRPGRDAEEEGEFEGGEADGPMSGDGELPGSVSQLLQMAHQMNPNLEDLQPLGAKFKPSGPGSPLQKPVVEEEGVVAESAVEEEGVVTESGVEGEASGEEFEEVVETGLVDEGPEPEPEPEPWPPLRRVLFYPRERKLVLGKHVCPGEPEPFEGRPGVYLEGSIVPPLADVNVSVVADSDSATAGWRAGEVVMWGLTREEGVYIVGPLYDDATYHAEPAKEGYIFRGERNNTFVAEQLASITVSITRSDATDAAAAQDDESSPSPILLSLSGDNHFARNTPAPQGKDHTFLGLFPGSYYLRPLLKEFEFDPPSATIQLESGQQARVTFQAKRVAFSVSGQVVSLLRAPEEGVVVEARSSDSCSATGQQQQHQQQRGHYERATTDAKGRFRLRGLQPGVEYAIQVVVKGADGQSRFERAMPDVLKLNISSDVRDVEFIVFDRAPSVLTGTVEGADAAKWQPHLRVEVVPLSSPSRVERSAPLPLSRFFEFRDLPQGQYVVRLRLGLSERTHTFEAEEVEVDLRHSGVVHAGVLKFRASERDARL